jgi:hypothetical protein
MGWLKKKLKKITKVVDPIGHQVRKSTGGSYGNPLNWNRTPQAAPGYTPRESGGLTAAPDGVSTLPTMKLGGSSGGYGYVPNRFANAGPVKPPGQPNVPTPSVPPNTGAMSFGGGQPMNPSGPGMMGGAMMSAAGRPPMAPQMGNSMRMAAQNYMQQNPQQPNTPPPQPMQPPMQQQMAQINALRRPH